MANLHEFQLEFVGLGLHTLDDLFVPAELVEAERFHMLRAQQAIFLC